MNRRLWTIVTILTIALGAGIPSYRIGVLSLRGVPPLHDVLGGERMPEEVRLYGARDPRLRSTERLDTERRQAAVSYLTNRDGTTAVTILQEDGRTPRSAKEYFTLSTAGKRLRADKQFADDGTTVVNEDNYRQDGTTNFLLRSLAGGNREVTSFYEDGESVASVLVKPAKNETILKESKWTSPENGHYLWSESTLGDKQVRTLCEFGPDHSLLKRRISGTEDKLNGTIIDGFYPGTDKVRLHAETNYYETTARYLRPDGTLDWKMALSISYLNATFYDKTGTKARLEKKFAVVTEPVPGTNGKWKDRYVISFVSEIDASGKMVRSFEFNVGKELLQEEKRYMFTKNGVKYFSGSYKYRITGSPEEIGTLETVDLFAFPVMDHIVEKHSASENIRAVIPPDEISVPILIDDLPVPPPAPYMYGM